MFKKFRREWKVVLCLILMFVVGGIVYITCDKDIVGAIGFAVIVAYCFVDHEARKPIQTS